MFRREINSYYYILAATIITMDAYLSPLRYIMGTEKLSDLSVTRLQGKLNVTHVAIILYIYYAYIT